MKTILHRLELVYNRPVDIEFTVDILPGYPKPDFVVHLLQCRPQSSWRQEHATEIPANVAMQDKIFSANRLVPQGTVSRIRYVVYVDPAAYADIRDRQTQLELARVVGRLNTRLGDKRFILMGPGRWGSSNPDLGIKVSYTDIYNTSMLIELAMEGGAFPEASYGTHFFQDLVEAEIYPLILYPQDEGVLFRRGFFEQSPNALGDLLPNDAMYGDCIRVIDVAQVSDGKLLEVVMNSEEEQALAYLKRYAAPNDL